MLDHALCPHWPAAFNPQLHAYWHLLSGLSVHWVVMWLSYVHLEADAEVGLCATPRLVRTGPWDAVLPFVASKLKA